MSKVDSSDQPPSYDASMAEAAASPSLNHVRDIPNFKPIVLPQTTAKLLNTNISPFARAYPLQLKPLMSDEFFLRFIDDLNEAFMAAPIFQLLGLAGVGMSLDPTGIVGFIGAGVQVGAGLAGGANSYVRTRKFVNAINASTFRPMGLRVRVLSTSKMVQEIKYPQAANLAPLPECNEAWDPSSPALDPRRRRLAAFGDHVAALDWDVAPQKLPDNFMRKAGAWHAEFQEKKQRRKQDRRLRRLHSREARAATRQGTEEDPSKYDARRAKAAARLERKGDSWLAQKKYERKMAKYDRKEKKGFKKASRKRNKYERKERWCLQRIRWVVITEYDWSQESEDMDKEDGEDVDVGIEEVEGGPSDASSSEDEDDEDDSEDDDEDEDGKTQEPKGGLAGPATETKV